MDATPMVLTLAEVMPAAAEVFVGLAACLLLLVDALGGSRTRNAVFFLAISSLAGAAWVSSAVALPGRSVALAGHFVVDPMGTVLKLFAYGAAALTLLYSRDYLERRELLKGEYLVLALFTVLGISATYEFIEWWTALASEEASAAFLGTQGDVWDTQWDMFLAGCGAIAAQLVFERLHDRQLAVVDPGVAGKVRPRI